MSWGGRRECEKMAGREEKRELEAKGAGREEQVSEKSGEWGERYLDLR